MKLIYDIGDRPALKKTIVFAFQQMIAIMAATLLVPILMTGFDQTGTLKLDPAAALCGAGIGTLVYLLFTGFKSPVFLGSSFAFLPSMFAAFGGAVSVQAGYMGLLIGAGFAALVYVILAIVVKLVGTAWIDKVMPAVVIGPTVAIIGLCLAGNAVTDAVGGIAIIDNVRTMDLHGLLCLIVALVTLAVVMLCSVYGKKMLKLIPFVIGILAGYICAAILTVIGSAAGIEAMKIVDFSGFQNIAWIPDFTFLTAFKGISEIGGTYIGTILVAYAPVAFVVFAEHLADHKNLSSIIEKDLLKEPGLHRTLLGDGIGSFAGAIFGGCPNTTYGESIGCVAISGNASVVTILYAAIMAMVISFFGPFATFLASIPSCVMGGVCIALYGFIAVSGLKMIQKVDLNDNRNLFVVSVVLIAGVGGLVLKFGAVTLTDVACALILGILTNWMLGGKKKEKKAEDK